MRHLSPEEVAQVGEEALLLVRRHQQYLVLTEEAEALWAAKADAENEDYSPRKKVEYIQKYAKERMDTLPDEFWGKDMSRFIFACAALYHPGLVNAGTSSGKDLGDMEGMPFEGRG